MYDGLLEAYGQVVWLPGKKFFHPQFLLFPGGKNTPKTRTYNYFIPLLSAAISTFWPISSNLMMFVWQFLFLNEVYGLRRDKVNLGCDKKFFGHFWAFFGPKFGNFAKKSGFWLFSWKPLIRISRNFVRNSRQLLSII